MKRCTIHTDGAARGNPGPAGAGVVIKTGSGQTITKIASYLGSNKTNNQAEYMALDLGLKEALNKGYQSVEVWCDSELLVKQINGEYKVKSDNIKPIHQSVINKIQKLKYFAIKHIPRDQNKEADKLANKAIDDHLE